MFLFRTNFSSALPFRKSQGCDRVRAFRIWDCLRTVFPSEFPKFSADDRVARQEIFAGCVLGVTPSCALKKGDWVWGETP